MTEEEWIERLRAFDRCREAHAHTLDEFRARVEAARRTLGGVIREMEAERAGLAGHVAHKPRLRRSWITRAPRPESRKHARAAGARLRELTAEGERWSVWETTPARSALFVGGEVDGGRRRGGKQAG